jgi:hypothetical protein
MTQPNFDASQGRASPLQAIFENQAGSEPQNQGERPRLQSLKSLFEGALNQRRYAEPSAHLLPCVHLIMADGNIMSFQYHQLESPAKLQYLPQGMGQRIEMIFSGIDEHQVSIEGYDLIELFDLMAQHRIAWVREARLTENTFDSQMELKIEVKVAVKDS